MVGDNCSWSFQPRLETHKGEMGENGEVSLVQHSFSIRQVLHLSVRVPGGEAERAGCSGCFSGLLRLRVGSLSSERMPVSVRSSPAVQQPPSPGLSFTTLENHHSTSGSRTTQASFYHSSLWCAKILGSFKKNGDKSPKLLGIHPKDSKWNA